MTQPDLHFTGYFIGPEANNRSCGPVEAETYALYGEALGTMPTLLLRSTDPEAIWRALDGRMNAHEATDGKLSVSYRDTLYGSVEAGEITFQDGRVAKTIFCLWERLTSLICDDLPDSDDPEFRDDDFDNHALALIRDAGSLIANGLA